MTSSDPVNRSDLADLGASSPRPEGAPPVHHVVVLETGEDALLVRLHLLFSAEDRLDVQTFILEDDDVGRLFLRELIRAARRGVRVRLLVDHFGLAKNPELVAAVASASPNLRLRVYNCLSNQLEGGSSDMALVVTEGLKPVNQRMHGKLFLVDDWAGVTGGRNYGNDYFDRGATRNFRDRDVLVVGPQVREMLEAFEAFWNDDLSVEATELEDVSKLLAGGEVPESALDTMLAFDEDLDEPVRVASLSEEIRRRFVDRAIRVSSARFVWDPPGKNDGPSLSGPSRTQREFLRFVGEAQARLWIQSPYVVLDATSLRAFKELRRRRPELDVRISTNSLASTDNLIAYALSHKDRKKFLKKLRFRLFELKPTPRDIKRMIPRYDALVKRLAANRDEILGDLKLSFERSFELREVHACIHAKTYLVDESVWIGSYNLDPRSAHLNTEVGLILEGSEVASTLRETLEQDMAPGNSWTVGRTGNRPWRALFEEGLYRWLLRIPGIKFWPFRHSADFELKPGAEEVPHFDERFHDHYVSAGAYPEVSLNTRELEVTLVKAFLGFIRPLT